MALNPGSITYRLCKFRKFYLSETDPSTGIFNNTTVSYSCWKNSVLLRVKNCN